MKRVKMTKEEFEEEKALFRKKSGIYAYAKELGFNFRQFMLHLGMPEDQFDELENMKILTIDDEDE